MSPGTETGKSFAATIGRSVGEPLRGRGEPVALGRRQRPRVGEAEENLRLLARRGAPPQDLEEDRGDLVEAAAGGRDERRVRVARLGLLGRGPEVGDRAEDEVDAGGGRAGGELLGADGRAEVDVLGAVADREFVALRRGVDREAADEPDRDDREAAAQCEVEDGTAELVRAVAAGAGAGALDVDQQRVAAGQDVVGEPLEQARQRGPVRAVEEREERGDRSARGTRWRAPSGRRSSWCGARPWRARRRRRR